MWLPEFARTTLTYPTLTSFWRHLWKKYKRCRVAGSRWPPPCKTWNTSQDLLTPTWGAKIPRGGRPPWPYWGYQYPPRRRRSPRHISERQNPPRKRRKNEILHKIFLPPLWVPKSPKEEATTPLAPLGCQHPPRRRRSPLHTSGHQQHPLMRRRAPRLTSGATSPKEYATHSPHKWAPTICLKMEVIHSLPRGHD